MNTQRRDFDKDAAGWDEEPTRVKLASDIFDAINQQVRLTRDMEVLDFGCGTGLVSLRVAPLVKSVTGADSSQGMLDVFRAKAGRQGQANVSALHLDPDRPDFPPGPYDLILSSMTFHHVEHPAALLAQMFGALKSPGYLCVADLDLDQGEFHADNTGVFHFGFERAELHRVFLKAGFSQVRGVTAAKVAKTTSKGVPRLFSVFLMVGEKR